MTWHITQIHSKRALAVQEEVHRNGFGTYMPIMRSKRYVDGKPSDTRKLAFPGYMFVWGAIGHFYARDGRTIIARTLGDITEDEFNRVRADNTAGLHDEIAAPQEVERRKRVRRRRPRPGKRARMAMRNAA